MIPKKLKFTGGELEFILHNEWDVVEDYSHYENYMSKERYDYLKTIEIDIDLNKGGLDLEHGYVYQPLITLYINGNNYQEHCGEYSTYDGYTFEDAEFTLVEEPHITERVKNLHHLISDVKKDLKKYCADKSIPLEERWKTFIDSDLGDHDRYKHDPDGVDNTDLCQYFWYEKGESVSAIDLLDSCKLEGNEDLKFNETEFKEYFLKEFVKSFTYDW